MFREQREETSCVWEERGSREKKVKARKIDGEKEGGRCKLTKEQRKVCISVVRGQEEAKLLLAFLCSNRRMWLLDQHPYSCPLTPPGGTNPELVVWDTTVLKRH